MPPGDQLMELAKSGNHDAAERLLSLDPSLAQFVNEQGPTPSHFATLSGNRPLVSLLSWYGANTNQREGTFGATPTGWVIESLRQQGGTLAIAINDVLFAIQHGHIDWPKRLVARFPGLLHARDVSGTAILETARASGNSAIEKLFRTNETEGRS